MVGDGKLVGSDHPDFEFVAAEPRLPIFGGKWEMSYGELFSGGDMALFTWTEGGFHDRICVFQEHGADVTDDYNTASVATAELFLRAPRLLSLVQRLAQRPIGTERVALQDEAQALLDELAAEWSR